MRSTIATPWKSFVSLLVVASRLAFHGFLLLDSIYALRLGWSLWTGGWSEVQRIVIHSARATTPEQLLAGWSYFAALLCALLFGTVCMWCIWRSATWFSLRASEQRS